MARLRTRSRPLHPGPDSAWLVAEVAALDALLGDGRFDEARERVRAALDATAVRRGCGRWGGADDDPCPACAEIDEAALAIEMRDAVARLALGFGHARPADLTDGLQHVLNGLEELP